MTVAIILARGGSVGCPKKNVALVGGMPLVTRAARTAALVCEAVYVSTDCDEIAQAAREGGAEVIARPASLAGPEITAASALRHAIHSRTLHDADLTMIQCTNPFMSADDIRGTIAAVQDMAVCVAECGELLMSADGRPINWTTGQTLRQDRSPQYRLVGSVWAFPASYVLAGEMYRGRVGLFVTSGRQIDIDTPADLSLCRKIIGYSDA